MSQETQNAAPDVTLIVPVAERYDDPGKLYRLYVPELEALGKSFEFLFVVDGGQEKIVPSLRRLKEEGARVVFATLSRPFGEAAALSVGLSMARGETILTLASYLQVEASGVRAALAELDAGADLVVARRYPRRDSILNRAQANVFNWIVRRLTGTLFHDIACGFRAMKREVAGELDIYGDLHRFVPVLALREGFRVVEIPVPQREEDRGLRYAGPGIYLRRLLDILSVFFLVKFTRKPLRFFGLVGTAVMVPGVLVLLYLGAYRLLGFGAIGDRPLLLLGVLLVVLGFQSLSLGLIGEIVIFTHARKLVDYKVAEIA